MPVDEDELIEDAPEAVDKAEGYRVRAAESLEALGKATSERERVQHRRAHGVWLKLAENVGQAALRVEQERKADKKKEKFDRFK